jgi:pyruvate dehydrogenase E1 component alpha subunit
MEYTPIESITAVKNPAADRASAYGLESIIIDGNDADIVYRTAQDAYKKAREGNGPSLIECKTYRHSGHSRADPGSYRPKGEVEYWKENNDPIKRYKERLAEFLIDASKVKKIESDIIKEVDEATEFAKKSPMPPESILTENVYSDGGWAWRN